MEETNLLELWNLVSGVPAKVGAQKNFNVVGRLKNPTQIDKLFYSLNSNPEKLVFFNSKDKVSERMENLGDFNIDTIELEDLQTNNTLVFRAIDRDGKEINYSIDFPIDRFTEESPSFQLNLEGIQYPQQVGQVVEGRWLVNQDDETGEPCLEILPEDTGYDKIVLFGRYDWTDNYEIYARFRVTDILDDHHNCGVFFKWNPLLQGDGTCLPTQWSTGIAYFSSLNKGLRIRFGVNADRDDRGKMKNSYLLDEEMLDRTRYWQGRILRGLRRRVDRINPNLWQQQKPPSQLVKGKQYCLRMLVDPEQYCLTFWQHGTKEPSPQVVATKPIDRLPQGSVGITTYYCGLRLYEFQVSPIKSRK